MALVTTIPERKVINKSLSLSLVAGDNLKILVNDVVVDVDGQEYDFNVPANKKIGVRIDLKGVLIAE